jgi:RNA polymerase sigma-70 factor (ECF subfamily)
MRSVVKRRDTDQPGPDSEPLTDAELVQRCLTAGRSYDAAFEELYARHADRVFGFLLKLTSNRTAAEDALQETFLRVYKGLERFDHRRSLSAWILQIARYVAIDAFRVEKKVKRLEERRAQDTPEVERPPESSDAEVNERKRVVDEVLDALSMDDRSLLLLRHFEGMTFKAIGQVIDCSARTAQNRVEAAARRFQAELKARRGLTGRDL